MSRSIAMLCARLEQLRRHIIRLAHLSVGLSDYETYVQHLRTHHPQCRIPDYAEFYRERTEARYHGGGGRCC